MRTSKIEKLLRCLFVDCYPTSEDGCHCKYT
jgi:hypothetical protein